MITARAAGDGAGVRLAAVAGHLPAGVVTNDDLQARGLDTTDEWIRTRTGITSRRVAAADESVVDLATIATAKALSTAGVDGADVDLFVLATCTRLTQIPAGAAQLAERVGGRGAALDLNAGCAGSCHALALASDAIRGGSARTAVVVGAEKLTDWVDPDDRATAILFGDGAGAYVLTADDDPARRDVGPVAWASDGAAGDAIGTRPADGRLRMDGQRVFRWATTQLSGIARAACDRAGVAAEELAAFVPHQANARIIDGLVASLGIDEGRTVVAREVATTGNTSAASVPLALAALLERGDVPTGAPALLIAFGAGLSVAAQVVRAP